jgi:stage V sporulation protein D (sporulation-specific penicillin-binding protein)
MLLRRRTHQGVRLLCVGFAILALWLIYIQLICHGHYLHRAQSVQVREWILYAQRGTIYDRNGVPLAESAMRYSAFADPTEIKKPRATTTALASVLHMDQGELYATLRRPGTRFVRLKRHLADATADRIAALRLRGVGLQLEPARRYPQGTAAAQTLGFVGAEATQPGLAGLEASFNRVLSGHNGRLVAEIDARGALIPGRRIKEEPAADGSSIVLTLDARLQEIAEAQLAQAVETYSARGGTVVIMDPHSGEILALANLPSFDPNTPLESPPETWVNPAVTYAYEPGSTFKLITACAALEEGAVSLDDTFYCHGALQVGTHTIHCAHNAHGMLTLAGIIEKSCNIGAATVALRLGSKRLLKYVKRFGFCAPVGLGVGAEATGFVPEPKTENWAQITLANMGFGQGITVTPIQLLSAYCTVANNGIRPRPHLVKRIVNADGDTVKEYHYAGQRVLSPTVARTVREMLVQVVEAGTGKAAQIAGYRVAGKTGTAQKACPGVGYASGKFTGSFVGFFPADQPKLAVIAVIDEPAGAHYGGVVAAPAFREIAVQSMAYLGIPPTQVASAGAGESGRSAPGAKERPAPTSELSEGF